ncbi:hypothetical protein [Tenacibaculum phage Larrie]|nr:hypothetical protein [Tenacibaculum phage Larrie]
MIAKDIHIDYSKKVNEFKSGKNMFAKLPRKRKKAFINKFGRRAYRRAMIAQNIVDLNIYAMRRTNDCDIFIIGDWTREAERNENNYFEMRVDFK